MAVRNGSTTERIVTAKAGSILRFEREHGVPMEKFTWRVQSARNSAKQHGIVTIMEREGNAVIVKLLNDIDSPATKAELKALESKRAPTLIEWARKRTPAVNREPLVEVLPTQDPGRAARRMDRIASAHPEVGAVAPAPEGAAAKTNGHSEPQPGASFNQAAEEHGLWRDVYVTAQRTNPMGLHEDRVKLAGEVVGAFRQFFGL